MFKEKTHSLHTAILYCTAVVILYYIIFQVIDRSLCCT